MAFLKKLHPVFQFVIIVVLFALYIATAIHYHVNAWAALLLLIESAAFGASITTHEENTLKYNLEDFEQDLLKGIESRLGATEKKVLAKVVGLAGKAKVSK